MSRSALVIGAGFAGISAAADLAKRGFSVTVVEKNATPGGRARVLRENGYVFDMGPSWYWMPEVFEQWFAHFGQHVSDHYDLVRLDPSYQVIFGDNDAWSIPATRPALRAFFEQVEPGAGAQLDRFLEEAGVKYELGMHELVHRPSLSWGEYAHPKLISGILRSAVFRSLRAHVADHFQSPRLRQLMEFPVLFLGATPARTPALYSLMNYADMALGTWYPMGGMGRIVEGMVRVAEAQGARFLYDHPVQQVLVRNGRAVGVRTAHSELFADVVVAGADYHHVDQHLLAEELRAYSPSYWEKRVMAPSSLLFYLGFDTRLKKLLHHSLFFDEDLDRHASEIYDAPQWPSRPLMYVSAPSVTDPGIAPPGHENVVTLIPIAPGLSDEPEVRQRYLDLVLDRLTRHTGQDLRRHLVHQRSYCIADFEQDYNAFRGNAYGLANTLLQTAVLKPRMKSRKVAGLYYTGQLTVPGPGVPPSIISGQVVAGLVDKDLQRMHT
ncbi:MAG: phytoene desaturase [Flavobacteriales bacterium]|nr:phytoene desaturase [Flavobacteriales bacterium]MBK7942418.1 phytoene desaturase [Flavobacteriales bacterium]MBK8948234.1 phytoene desaturase [Flavobacteriales bacterium]